MQARVGATVLTVMAVLLLSAAAAPAAFAAWYISDPVGQDIGFVVKTSSTKFTVKENPGVKVGSLVKTASGNWKVMRGGTTIAVVKAEGARKYPVSLLDKNGTGLRIGCCGLNGDGVAWSLIRCAGGKPVVYVGSAEMDCPGRAAMGAARLLLW